MATDSAHPTAAAVHALPSPLAVRPTPGAPAAPRPTAVPNVAYHVPILMYHRIVPAAEAGNSLRSMVVEPELFRSQLEKLRLSGWRTVTLETLAAAMATGKPLPPRTFVITIDDGWGDGYRYAFPILRDLGLQATYFVIAGRIGSGSFLSGRQLRELEAAGNEIGNHTMDHATLSSLTYPEALAEIERASATLERVVGREPVSLAYPKGGVAPFVMAAARECPGLEIAVTTENGQTESWSDRFEVPRLTVNSSVTPSALVAIVERGQ